VNIALVVLSAVVTLVSITVIQYVHLLLHPFIAHLKFPPLTSLSPDHLGV
jgi:hypothetical protein